MDIKRNLEDEMRTDRVVIDYLADRSLAIEFYAALCNMRWFVKQPPLPDDEQIIKKLKGEEEVYWSCSWRYAGGIIAEIRNLHHNTDEDYMDFYCAGEEGTVSELVLECFDRMGWIPKEYDDDE